MRCNRLFSLIVAIGTMALAIALTINAGAAASSIASVGNAPLDQHDRHLELACEVVTAFDVEQARLSWEVSVPVVSAQNSASSALDQQTREATQTRWLAQHGGTNRTCVLLCGGQ
jgi:hypothetical protein